LYKALQECVRIGHPFKVFRKGFTVVLRKKGKTEELAQIYRPITLLNCFGKILEKIIQMRLSALTLGNISKHQYGAKKGYSAVDALASLAHFVELSIKRKK
jgi:hypothetical protein